MGYGGRVFPGIQGASHIRAEEEKGSGSKRSSDPLKPDQAEPANILRVDVRADDFSRCISSSQLNGALCIAIVKSTGG